MASRSASVPGTAAAIGANALTPAVTLRSANMPKDTAPKTSRIVQMNDVGPSTATEATPTTTSPPTDQLAIVMARGPRQRRRRRAGSWAARRRSRGTTASTSTPTQAAAKMMMNGSSST